MSERPGHGGPAILAPGELEQVEALLGRPARCDFEVVCRRVSGEPAVIRNAPLLFDGTPMPTRFWLVDPHVSRCVGTLEAEGWVRGLEARFDPEVIASLHRAYAAERDTALPPGWEGHVPSGGVGGTAVGLKCLHAHLANHLGGGVDPVGEAVALELEQRFGVRSRPGEVDVVRVTSAE